MNKPVIVFIDDNFEAGYETVKDAQEAIEGLGVTGKVEIFTLYMKGEFELSWKLQADTGTNLREAKKEAAPRSSGTWTDLEQQALVDSVEAGTPFAQIAKTLGRSYNAVYCKYNALMKKEEKE